MLPKDTSQMSFRYFESREMDKAHASSKGFYEFFAGGVKARAGLGNSWTCLFSNDIDEKKADAYRQNWGSGELLVKDVGKICTCELPGIPELVWASFPCQDFSLAGNGAGLNCFRACPFWPLNLIRKLTLKLVRRSLLFSRTFVAAMGASLVAS